MTTAAWTDTSSFPQRLHDLGHVLDPDGSQLYLLTGGQIQYTIAEMPGDVGQSVELLRCGLAVGDPHPHHELTGRGLSEKGAYPFETFAVSGVQRLPASVLGRQLFDILENIQAVFLRFVPFDRVFARSHGPLL